MRKSLPRLTFLAVVLGGVSLGVAPSASASVLTPGAAPTSPDVFTTINGSVVASIPSSPFLGQLTGSIFGTYKTEVVADSDRGGQLDFLIQVTNGTGSQVLEQVSTGVFDGFFVDAGFLTGTAPGGYVGSGVNPTNVNETINTVVSFNFVSPNTIPAGASSAVLVVQTNALAFQDGSISIIDSSTATVRGFAPAAVPEPASLALFGTALAGLGLLRNRRRKNG